MDVKGCPFCGRVPKLTTRAGSKLDGAPWVSFLACMCGGHSARAHQGAKGQTPEEAANAVIEKWNTRAQQ